MIYIMVPLLTNQIAVNGSAIAKDVAMTISNHLIIIKDLLNVSNHYIIIVIMIIIIGDC